MKIVHSQKPARHLRRHRLLGVVVTLCLSFAVSSAVASAGELPTPLPVPAGKKPTSGDVTATVSVSQEDDVFDLSPGLDYHAMMTWWSTKEEGDRTPTLTALSGKGTFTAAVDATLLYPPDTACGNPHYKLNASGAVEPVGNLNFSFVPKDIDRPGLGLTGWSIFTPIALWKDKMYIEKSAPCENSSEDGGSSFSGVSLVGGSKTGGTRIAAPKVVVGKSGAVTISGQGRIISTGAGGAVSRTQVVRFSVTCARAESCFGYPDNQLENSWKYLGSTCEAGPGGTVRLRVRVRMAVRNGTANWAQGMRVQGRLVPTTTGLNLPRGWTKQGVGGLVQNNRYSQDFEFVTDTVSPTKDWALQLKYTWDISKGRDVVEEIKGTTPIACLNDPTFVGG